MWRPVADLKLQCFGQLGDLGQRRESIGGVLQGWESPCCALLVDEGVDGGCEVCEEAHSEAVAQTAQAILSGSPAKAEGRDAVIFDERREEGEGDEGQAEVFGYVACHVGFVDQHGVEVSLVDCLGAVAEDHAGGVLYAFDGEAEGCEAFQLAEAPVQLLRGFREGSPRLR